MILEKFFCSQNPLKTIIFIISILLDETSRGPFPAFGSNLNRVREVTIQRQRDRVRQLQQIQVDRQIQKSKDIEAMANFRRTFYAKGNSIQPQRQPPMGVGEQLSMHL